MPGLFPGIFYFCHMPSTENIIALIVDDDKLGSFLLKSLLQKSVDTIYIVQNASEAINCMKSNPQVNFVFSDFHLPDSRGDELILDLKKINSNLKYAIVSGNQYSDIGDLRINVGHDQFITKPATADKLTRCFESYR